MKLPKLYRKVYLKFEWIVDSLQGGEHHQDWGFNYIPAMRVLDTEGDWFWSVTDWCGLEGDERHFGKYTHHEEDGWSAFDLNELDEDGQFNNYHCSYNRLTIKEQKRRAEPVKPSEKVTQWCSDIPF